MNEEGIVIYLVVEAKTFCQWILVAGVAIDSVVEGISSGNERK